MYCVFRFRESEIFEKPYTKKGFGGMDYLSVRYDLEFGIWSLVFVR